MKKTYKESFRKKRVREFLFSFFDFDNLVGLPGPDINDYITFCKSRGYKNIDLWERDKHVIIKQLRKLEHSDISHRYGDIINSTIKADTLYDLDYCCTIKTLNDHVLKFEKNFIMTLCLRKSIVENRKTLDQFFYLRHERVMRIDENKLPIKYKLITTDSGKYIYTSYRDNKCPPMCCIARIK